MRRSAVLSLALLPLFSVSCQRVPRLQADSLLALHQSAEAMKHSLGLSARDAVALDGAIDVLVGDATRRVLAGAEGQAASPGGQASAEAIALAPVDGLSLAEVISAAAEKELDPREAGDLGELRSRVAVVDGQLRQLRGVDLASD